MQRAYWLNWKRLTWSCKTYMYFVADYGLVLFTSDASLTFVDIFPLAETITNLQVVCCFLCFQPWFELWKCQREFLIDDQRKTARTLQWLLDFDWLPISHECLILSANCITMPDKVIIKNAKSQTSICQWGLAKQSSKQCFSRVREIRIRGVFVSVEGVYARNIR